jgi:hypothetical protein
MILLYTFSFSTVNHKWFPLILIFQIAYYYYYYKNNNVILSSYDVCQK